MISVMIIDPDWHLASMLKGVIANHPDIIFVGIAQTGAEGLEMIKKYKGKNPLFVLMAMELPDILGESLCRYIHRHWPKVSMILTVHSVHWPTLSRLVESPAKGYLSKQRYYLAMDAIRAVYSGKTYLQPDLALELLRYRKNPTIPQLEMLSSREYEIILLLARNKTYEEIVEITHVSIKTVYNLKVSACKKLGIEEPAQIRGLIFSEAVVKH
ncbi:MAG: response regulator transcription factor [Proteobacteria bacterium]|nr:response regulator transcription factor [Pseudomonadota bacterium]